MHVTRVPFDPAAAFKVSGSEPLVICGHVLEVGAPFPWRDIGLSEQDVYVLWLGFKIDVDAEPVAEQTVDAPGIASASTAAALEQREQSARKKQPRAAR